MMVGSVLREVPNETGQAGLVGLRDVEQEGKGCFYEGQ